MNAPTRTGTSQAALQIARMIAAAGVAEDELVAHVMREFPHLTVAELSQALLQVGPIDGPTEKHLDVISHDGARNARKDILEAIDMLRAVERLLSYRINEE